MMHRLSVTLSDKSGYNYDLVNDKNGKIIHSWKNPKMLQKWIDGYVPGNGRNFIQYVEKNGSAKIKIKPNKFVIPFRENKLNELDWNQDLSRMSSEISRLFQMAKIKVIKHIPYKRGYRRGDAALYGAFIHVKDKDGEKTVLPIEIDKKGIIRYAGGPNKWHPLEKIGAINMSHARPDDYLKIKTYARSIDYLKQFQKMPGFGQSVLYKKENVNELEYKPIALDGILSKSQEIGKDFRKMAHAISKDLDAKDNRVVSKCLKAYNNYFALLKQMNKVLK